MGIHACCVCMCVCVCVCVCLCVWCANLQGSVTKSLVQNALCSWKMHDAKSWRLGAAQSFLYLIGPEIDPVTNPSPFGVCNWLLRLVLTIPLSDLLEYQDFIPPEELAKLAAKSGDKAAAEALEKKNAIGELVLGRISHDLGKLYVPCSQGAADPSFLNNNYLTIAHQL